MNNSGPVSPFSDWEPNARGDCYVLLAGKTRNTTRDGKPYYRVVFRDAGRSATVMVWADSPLFDECEAEWREGQCYKIRGRYHENQYGPQLDIEKARAVIEDDRRYGFDPDDFMIRGRFDPAEQLAELMDLAAAEIADEPLRLLTTTLLDEHADTLLTLAAATGNHHAYAGGFLEHVLSVTRTAVFLADKYTNHFPGMQPPLSKSLVVAGAILHDIGKLRELHMQPQGARYTAAGRLIGHILLGRDLVREAARHIEGMDAETLLRLEHIIVSHQNRPEWGSPIAPHSPEALLVHYADDIDAKFHMMAAALETPPVDEHEEFTGRDNPLRRAIFRGLFPTQDQIDPPSM